MGYYVSYQHIALGRHDAMRRLDGEGGSKASGLKGEAGGRVPVIDDHYGLVHGLGGPAWGKGDALVSQLNLQRAIG